MATKQALLARYGIEEKEQPLPYESASETPRTIAKIEAAPKGGWKLLWADEDGVLYRHTTSRSCKEPQVGAKVVGGWLDDGYCLIEL